MAKHIIIKPQGVCAKEMHVDIEDSVIQNYTCIGGCNGNSKAVGALLKDMDVTQAIQKLSGIQCKERGTSCADQLAKGLQQWVEENSVQQSIQEEA